ncbi:AMP-binding protein, partial [candidate division GN15 bacterium]|nr:AMP-binding protein [candidate division GN15 bacterium]
MPKSSKTAKSTTKAKKQTTSRKATSRQATIETYLKEKRSFKPSAAFSKQATASKTSVYTQASRNAVKFWESMASELVWKKRWTKALQWKAPDARWFIGGKLNITETCLDQHLANGRRNKAALIWEGEPGDRKVLTYFELHRQVCKFANSLKGLGVKKGDRVAIYLPMIPELVVAMLACARIGAIHSVVFGGFSPESLADRINDAEAKVLITADGGYRRGQILPLKHDADVALANCPTIE